MNDPNDSIEQAAAALVPPAVEPRFLDGIPIGDYPDRVCYVPMWGGGYYLRDPEKGEPLELQA